MASLLQKVVGGGAVTASKPLKLYSHAGVSTNQDVASPQTDTSTRARTRGKWPSSSTSSGLPYETEIMDFGDLKKEPFEKLNPNGRVPAVEDPNTGLTLWESGAIIEYLLETYDSANASGLRYTDGTGKWEQRCWAEFQMSGQGPYFGQRAWFVLVSTTTIRSVNGEACLADQPCSTHPRRLSSALTATATRSSASSASSIRTSRSPAGSLYLCGDKLSYADLMFVPWHWLLFQKPFLMGEEFPKEVEKDYPEFWAWNTRMQERDAVAKAMKARGEAMSKGH